MIVTFFNNKPQCGKSTFTIYTAKTLVNIFAKENSRRVFIFDTVHNLNNSLSNIKEQEDLKTVGAEQRLFIEHMDDFSEYEVKKIDYSIQEEDLVFFDLQNFGQRQLDFILNSHFIFVISDSPNELERVDVELYDLLKKIKDNPYSISQIKKIFLTQNRVKENEKILIDFEDINYISGLSEIRENDRIEKISIYKNNNIPPFIQKFSIDVWKKVNDYKEQIILN